MNPNDVALEFVRRYESFWNAGAREVEAVYAPNAILCGYEIVGSHQDIGRVLGAIVGQGWTNISIDVVEAISAGNMVLLACLYSARSAHDEITSKSSYALVESDGGWKAAMHTAT